MKTIKCYRFVTNGLKSDYDKNTGWEIGKWNKIDVESICYKSGFHASLTPLQSLNNVFGNRWFIAEARGKIDKNNDKFCSTEMRIVKEIPIEVIKRFALFCAKDCLKNYEKEYPDDKRVSDCIRITELYLDGKATLEEFRAAKSAAVSAAWSAAWSAAVSAAWSAECAAWSAARSAAWSAECARMGAEKRQEKELKRLIKEYCK